MSLPVDQGASRHTGGILFPSLSCHVAEERRDEQAARPDGRPDQDQECDPDGRRELKEISHTHVRLTGFR